MIFTQEQIDEINRRLANRGIKDSEISKIDLDVNPMTGEETVVIIKDGESVRISIKDFFQQEVANLIEDLDIIRSNALEGKIARENQCIIKTDKDTAYFDNAGNDPNDQQNATLLGQGNTAVGYGAFAGGNMCVVGEMAAAFNTGNRATGMYSFATGTDNTASGSNSHAEGVSTVASGTESHAEGDQCQALGNSSHAEGDETIASGKQAHAEGHTTQAIGSSSHAEGKETEARGAHSHAEGQKTIAEGEDSHAEGTNTRAAGLSSHAEGKSNGALGAYSHVEGEDNVTGSLDDEWIGMCAHAEGSKTKAVGDYTHSEGRETVASGNGSHAEGNKTQAIGGASHAEGVNTIANNAGEHACGRHNVSNTGENDADKTIFSVGIGTGSDARKNGLEVRENGDIYLWLNNSYVRLQDILNRIGGTYAATVAEEELNTIVDDYLDKVE